MNEHVWIEEIGDHDGKEVVLRGWVHHHRPMKKLVFTVIRDGTGLCQSVVSRADVGDELFSVAEGWKRAVNRSRILHSQPTGLSFLPGE